MGQLRFQWQWRRESRHLHRARRREAIDAKTNFQLQSVVRQGAQLAAMAEEIEAGQLERADADSATEPAVGRLETCKGWVDEMARLYRRCWQGQVSPGTAALDALAFMSAAQLHVTAELEREAMLMEAEHQQLQQQSAAAVLQHDEQPAADVDVDEVFDASRPTIRVVRHRMTKT